MDDDAVDPVAEARLRRELADKERQRREEFDAAHGEQVQFAVDHLGPYGVTEIHGYTGWGQSEKAEVKLDVTGDSAVIAWLAVGVARRDVRMPAPDADIEAWTRPLFQLATGANVTRTGVIVSLTFEGPQADAVFALAGQIDEATDTARLLPPEQKPNTLVPQQ